MESGEINVAQLNELRRKVVELTVLESELGTLGKSAKVFKQQPNSQIFFLDNKTLIRKEVQKNLEDLRKKLQDFEK